MHRENQVPSNIEAVFNRAEDAFEKGSWEKALKGYLQTRELLLKQVEGGLPVTQLCLPDEIKRLFFPSELAAVASQIAKAYENLDQLELADAFLAEAQFIYELVETKDHPNVAPILMMRGRVSSKQGDAVSASGYFKRGVVIMHTALAVLEQQRPLPPAPELEIPTEVQKLLQAADKCASRLQVIASRRDLPEAEVARQRAQLLVEAENIYRDALDVPEQTSPVDALRLKELLLNELGSVLEEEEKMEDALEVFVAAKTTNDELSAYFDQQQGNRRMDELFSALEPGELQFLSKLFGNLGRVSEKL
ncbi:MAG: tetratricopeptide repeat protein, partial [Candidatus Obscuribacterales bacterium]|nr:tetratricopeptide repeat protein [Candidatus Obscuribacterales bacterium]